MRHRTLYLCLLMASCINYAVACNRSDAETFEDFFSKFSTSMEFALTRVPALIPGSHLAFGENEPIKLSTQITRDQFERAGTLERQAAETGRQFRKSRETSNEAEVKLHKPDTGWKISYSFVRRDNCWYLRGIDDEST